MLKCNKNPSSHTKSREENKISTVNFELCNIGGEFFNIYLRAFGLSNEDIKFAYLLVFVSFLVSIAELAVPVLFGKIIDMLGQLSINNNNSTIWFKKLSCLIFYGQVVQLLV